VSVVKLFTLCLLVALGAAVGCGDGNAGPGGGDAGAGGIAGSDGTHPAKQSSYRLSCTIATLILEIPIELSFELDRPYTEGGSADLTFSASFTFDERTATTLIDAGVSKIDIISVEIATSVSGATPSIIQTSFAAAPINDFDLEVDPDDNGVAGPHTLELDTLVVSTAVTEGADEVEFGLGLDRVSLLLGDFNVPLDCLGPSLVGFSASFPVE
jgi:hypothetical protein